MGTLKIILMSLFILFTTCVAYSSTYEPVELEKLLEGSDAVVEGDITGKVYKKLPSGDVVTEYSMKINRSAGLPLKYLSNSAELKLLVPGGKWQGHIYKIEGVPDLEDVKKGVFLIKQIEFGLALSSLSLSIFTYSKSKSEYVNYVFKNNKNLSNFSEEKFSLAINNRFGSSLVAIEPDKHVNVLSSEIVKSPKRMPSSVNESNENKFWSEETGFGLVLLILFALVFAWRKSTKLSKQR